MIFIDTNVLVAFIVEKDTNHEKAVSLMREIVDKKYGSAITSEYVFDETVTVVMVRSKSLNSANRVGDIIRESMQILYVDSTTFEASWKRFKNQLSTKFSFTDCTILELVETSGIENIATFDREFKDQGNFSLVN